MKENTKKNILIVLTVVILAISGYAAKIIGDMITQYKSFKTLNSLITLSIPVHKSISQLQTERSLNSFYIVARKDEDLAQARNQFKLTDKYLNNFGKELHATQLLMLSIPEAELDSTLKALSEQRNQLTDTSMTFERNSSFYTNIIDQFINFLEKMYLFADHEEIKARLNTLISIETYKEALSKEMNAVSTLLSSPQISNEELGRIKQVIALQLFQRDKLYSTQDLEIKDSLKFISNSPEVEALKVLRKKYEGQEEGFEGSSELGQEFFKKASAYSSKYNELIDKLIGELKSRSRDGIANFQKELITTCSIFAGIILVLVSLYILIQKIKT